MNFATIQPAVPGTRGRDRGAALVLASLCLAGLTGCRQGGTYQAPPPFIESFTAEHAEIELGETTNLLPRFPHGMGRVDQGIDSVKSGAAYKVKPLTTTTYKLTVTNRNGKRISSETVVTVRPGLDVTLKGHHGAADAVTVTGPGGFSRVVSEPTILKGLEQGFYTIKATPVVHGGKTWHPLKPVQELMVTTGTQATVQFAAPDHTVALPGGVALEFVTIPAGSFAMGTKDDHHCEDKLRANPVHTVTFERPFHMGRFLITRAQWHAVTGEPMPAGDTDLRQAMSGLSYQDIHARFLPALNQLHPGMNFRLPSEAEWEYACRAGTTTEAFFAIPGGSDYFDELPKYVWRDPRAPHAVGEKWANPWGLFDLAGLGLQWCEDAAHDGYEAAPSDGSPWIDPSATQGMVRGGPVGGGVTFTTERFAYDRNVGGLGCVFRVVFTK